MQFFVPTANDVRTAEIVWKAMRDASGRAIGDAKIFSLTYERGGRTYRAQVGERGPHVFEPVLAILESACYLVCTANHGGLRGQPIRVSPSELRHVELFDE